MNQANGFSIKNCTKYYVSNTYVRRTKRLLVIKGPFYFLSYKVNLKFAGKCFIRKEVSMNLLPVAFRLDIYFKGWFLDILLRMVMF